MLKHKSIIFRCVLIWVLASLFYACNGVTESELAGPAEAGMSPVPMVVSDIHPWLRAQQIAKEVPNSDVVVGHGDAMMPLYRSGTALVIQELQINNLRAGMTVVFYTNGNNPFDMQAAVLVKQIEDGLWEIASPGETDTPRRYRKLTDKTYLGTVVAALARPSEEQQIVEREFLVSTTNLNCTIQCHVAGQIHPLVVPGLQPKVTTFDLSKDN